MYELFEGAIAPSNVFWMLLRYLSYVLEFLDKHSQDIIIIIIKMSVRFKLFIHFSYNFSNKFRIFFLVIIIYCLIYCIRLCQNSCTRILYIIFYFYNILIRQLL